jgi:hypothetical protein
MAFNQFVAACSGTVSAGTRLMGKRESRTSRQEMADDNCQGT